MATGNEELEGRIVATEVLLAVAIALADSKPPLSPRLVQLLEELQHVIPRDSPTLADSSLDVAALTEAYEEAFDRITRWAAEFSQRLKAGKP